MRERKLPLAMPLSFPQAPPATIRVRRGEWESEIVGAPPYADLSVSVPGGGAKSSAALVRKDAAPVDRRLYLGLLLRSPRLELSLKCAGEGGRTRAVAVTLSLLSRGAGGEETLSAAAQTVETEGGGIETVLEWGSPLLEWEAEGTAAELVLALDAATSAPLGTGETLEARCYLREETALIVPRPRS